MSLLLCRLLPLTQHSRVGEKVCACTSQWLHVSIWEKENSGLSHCSSSGNSACGCSCLFLGEKALQQVAPGQATVGHHPHISHVPMLVSPHLEIPFLWAGKLRRGEEADVLETAKLALRLQPSSLFFFSSLETSLDKANHTNLICSTIRDIF